MKMKVKEFAEFPSCNQKYIGVAVGFAFRDLEAHSANKLCAARARAMNQMQVNGMVFNRTIKRARLQKIQRVRLCVYVYECAIARVKFTPPECRQRKRVINLHSKFMPHSSIHSSEFGSVRPSVSSHFQFRLVCVHAFNLCTASCK